MPDVLLATCAEFPEGDEDGAALLQALTALGVDAQWVAWTDVSHAWSDALVVLRCTWDYTTDRDRFLAWVSGLPRVVNPADVVAWNSDKTYLADLADAGVPVVPSVFAAPGEALALPDPAAVTEVVVKPTVGAGSRGVGRFVADRFPAARDHASALHELGRTVVVQPYLADVDTAGETALMYLDGRFSHAVRKGPMLPHGTTYAVADGPLFVEEDIRARTPDARELAVGERALGVVRERFGTDLLYARVDLLPTPDGPLLVELELTEPSLFLGHGTGHGAGPDPAASFAAAIAARV